MEHYENKSFESLEKAIPRLDEILYDKYLVRGTREGDAGTENEVVVDVGFELLAVDRIAAEPFKQELQDILALYPGTIYPDLPPLAQGPSYIHVGGALGSQGRALCLFALGEALDFWRVITPKRLFHDMAGDDISDAEAREMAGRGLVMIDGYRPH